MNMGTDYGEEKKEGGREKQKVLQDSVKKSKEYIIDKPVMQKRKFGKHPFCK